MYGVTGSHFSGSSIRNFLLLINYLISFKVVLNQVFLTPAGNLVTYAEFLGSRIKRDTSDPDSPELVNALFSSFTTSLKKLCKPLPILFYESSATFHSF